MSLIASRAVFSRRVPCIDVIADLLLLFYVFESSLDEVVRLRAWKYRILVYAERAKASSSSCSNSSLKWASV